MDRAEQIKEIIEKRSHAKKKGVVKATGSGGDHGGDDKGGSGGKGEGEGDEKDPEQAKLAAAVSQAIVTEKPNVKWEDVAGLEQAKGLLKEAVILPVKFPQLFTGKRTPWRGILLYGPPGTGKSFLAKAVATECGSSCFLSVSSSDLVSKFMGESERLVKQLFELARAKSPALVFVDEIDSLCTSRGSGQENDSARRIKTEFLVQMQGVGKDNTGVLVLGATNTPWELDPAIRRRFEKRVYIPLPELQARISLFKNHVGSTPNNLTPEDYRRLAELTDGFSGSDVSVVVRDALMEPVRTCQVATHFKKINDPTGAQPFVYQPCSPADKEAEEKTVWDIPSDKLSPMDVTMRHFEAVIHTAKASVNRDDLAQFEDWTKQFGQEG